MAAPRAYWKGHLRLSLVSIDVALYAATERDNAVPLRQIHRESGKRVRYQKIAPGIGPIENDDIVKGFELGDDRYVVLEPDELDEIKLESSRAIRLAQFVEQHEIDPRYYERPYYLTPEGEAAAEGYVVIREALRASKKVGIGQMTMRGREHLVAVKPCGEGLLLETLRYGDEVRDSDRVFDDVPEIDVDPEMLSLAEELIERKTAAFDPSAYQDSYALALRDLIEKKRAGKAVVEAEGDDSRGGAQVIDLMEALKKSLRDQSGGKGSAKPSSKGSGKGTAKGRAKSASKSSATSSAGARKRAGGGSAPKEKAS